MTALGGGIRKRQCSCVGEYAEGSFSSQQFEYVFGEIFDKLQVTNLQFF